MAVDARWELYLRSRTFLRQALLDTYTWKDSQSIDTVGTWALDFAVTDDPALNEDMLEFVAEAGDAGAGGGVILLRDGVVMLSGQVDDVIVSPDKITLRGRGDSAILADNLAMPVTGVSAVDFTVAEYEDRSGPAETVIRQFVEANIGPTARLDLIAPGLQDSLADNLAQGGVVAVQARFTNLWDLCREIAFQGGGLRVWVAQNPLVPGRRVYVQAPTDRTRDVVFSLPIGNLETYEDIRKAPRFNHLVGGGLGHADERIFAERADPVSVTQHGRRVGFLDARTVVDTDDLQNKLRGALLASANRRATTVEILDTEGTIFGVDYFLGDIVTVVVNGMAITGVVLRVDTTIDANGVRITPTIGTPGTGPDDPDDAVRRQIESVRRRLDNLEVNSIPKGSITSGLFGAGSVTASAIGAGAIVTSAYGTGSIPAAALGAGSVTSGALASGSVTRAALGALGLPIGMIVPYAGGAAPSLWLLCRGQVLVRASYAELFAVIGTNYNIGGEAGTDFRLPDLFGRFPLGYGNIAGETLHPLAQLGGNERTAAVGHTYSPDNLTTIPTDAGSNAPTQTGGGTHGDSTAIHKHTVPAVTDHPSVWTMQTYVTLNYLIFTGV